MSRTGEHYIRLAAVGPARCGLREEDSRDPQQAVPALRVQEDEGRGWEG